MVLTTGVVEKEDVEEEDDHPVFQCSAPMLAVPESSGARPAPEDVTENECLRQGCLHFAVRSPEWEDEYCSNECAVRHCKDVFAEFVASKMKAAQNGNS